MNKDVSKLNIKSALFLIKSDVSCKTPSTTNHKKTTKKTGILGSIGSIRQYIDTNIHDWIDKKWLEKWTQ